MPLASFYSPWKQQKTRGSFISLGDIEREQWHEMDEGRVMKVLGSLANYHNPVLIWLSSPAYMTIFTSKKAN